MPRITPAGLSEGRISEGRRASAAAQIPAVADVLIVGAGAAGLICAREAAGRGLRVTLLEAGTTPGRKISVCGGGKANFSNRTISPAHYHCTQPGGTAFCGPALSAFDTQDITKLVRAWNLPFEERSHGQLFLTVAATRLVDALAHDCRTRGCRIICNASVEDAWATEHGFSVRSGTTTLHTRVLVLAAGSSARPQAGGCGAGYGLAQKLGLTVIPPRPALTPLLLPQGHALRNLAGISLPIRANLPASATAACFEDDLLFTHDGLSGPVILKASLFWSAGQPLHLDFLPTENLGALLDAPECGRSTTRALLCRHLPQRLVDALLPEDKARRKVAELSRAARQELHAAVHAYTCIPSGAAGAKRAEVCAGGVDTRGLDPQSMAALHNKNLYVIGELQDITGLLGGYNLHWAWASGTAAGRHIALS